MQLELKDISKTYENGSLRQVLDDISLTISTGETLAIIGPSGSGKSTLLNIMGTLDQPSYGSVLFNGTEIGSFDEPSLASLRNKHIGFVFQKHYLLPQLNVLENVLVPVIPQKDKARYAAAQIRAKELLDKVGLADKLQRLPGQLSVGECQRAAVVRALINQPELILADEPTGSLDNDSAAHLGDLLASLKKDFTVAMVVVTHSPDFAQRMDKVYRLVNGRLLLSPLAEGAGGLD